MGPNRRNIDREEAAAREAQDELRRATNPIVRADAERYVLEWNERLARGAPHLFSPAIGAALAAGYPWLAVYCPACHTVQDVDLRTIDRHPRASLESLIPLLACRRCPGQAPLPELKGLSKFKSEPRRRSSRS